MKFSIALLLMHAIPAMGRHILSPIAENAMFGGNDANSILTQYANELMGHVSTEEQVLVACEQRKVAIQGLVDNEELDVALDLAFQLTNDDRKRLPDGCASTLETLFDGLGDIKTQVHSPTVEQEARHLRGQKMNSFIQRVTIGGETYDMLGNGIHKMTRSNDGVPLHVSISRMFVWGWGCCCYVSECGGG